MKPLACKIIVIGAAFFLGLVAQGQAPRIPTKPTNSLLEHFQVLRKANNPALMTNALKGTRFPAGTGTVTISRTEIQPVLMPAALPPAATNSPLITTPTNLPLPNLAAKPTAATNTVAGPAAAPPLVVTTNSIASTNAAPAEVEEPDGSSGILAQLKAQEQALRVQEKQPVNGEQAQVVALGTNELGDKLKDLEFTGEYVERFVRIPEGNAGKAKFTRFLVPVFRRK